MLDRLFDLLLSTDPVDRWLLEVCQSYGIDCTITWARVLTAMSSLFVATLVYFTVKLRRERWEVTRRACLCPLKRACRAVTTHASCTGAGTSGDRREEVQGTRGDLCEV